MSDGRKGQRNGGLSRDWLDLTVLHWLISSDCVIQGMGKEVVVVVADQGVVDLCDLCKLENFVCGPGEPWTYHKGTNVVVNRTAREAMWQAHMNLKVP